MRRFLLVPALGIVCLACASSKESASAETGAETGVPDPPPKPRGESEASKERAKDDATSIVLGVDSEPFETIGAPLAQVHVVATVDGLVAADETVDKAQKALFPYSLKLTAPLDELDATVEIVVTGTAYGAEAVTRTVRTRFVPNAAKLLYVPLEVRCNRAPVVGDFVPNGPKCEAPDTCIGGACRPSEAGSLPDYREDWATNPPSACGDGASVDLVVGRGQTTFTPLADGETVTLERGPQCGHHLWMSLRMKNLSQWKTITTLTASLPGGAKTIPATAYPYAYATGADGCALPGLRFQLDSASTKIADLLGQPLDVTVQLKDRSGRETSVTRHVIVSGTVTTGPGVCN